MGSEGALKIHRKAPETRIASGLSPIDIFVSLFTESPATFPKTTSTNRDHMTKGTRFICLYPILADLGFFDAMSLIEFAKRWNFRWNSGSNHTWIRDREWFLGSWLRGRHRYCASTENKAKRSKYICTVWRRRIA